MSQMGSAVPTSPLEPSRILGLFFASAAVTTTNLLEWDMCCPITKRAMFQEACHKGMSNGACTRGM